MKERFKQIPSVLQKQILLRFAAGVLFLILFAVILFNFRDHYLYLPCLVFAGFLIVNGALLFYNSIIGNYICVQGICEQIEVTGFRKRVKEIYVDLEQNTLRIAIRHRIKRIAVGDTIIVYLSDKTPVYEQHDGYMVCSYYAIEIKKGEQSDGF